MEKYGKGNIDLLKRPIVKNKDNTISTVRSMSFFDGLNHVLIPTIRDDGYEMSPEESIGHYYNSGKHLGKFKNPEEATQYSKDLHTEQEQIYSPKNNYDELVRLLKNK
ncbi:MAG: hypothetical protein EBR82_87645 [Caulobacteraceae bacterium]|nr:hypothetical protein [Caulobacteraceae bacterium]